MPTETRALQFRFPAAPWSVQASPLCRAVRGHPEVLDRGFSDEWLLNALVGHTKGQNFTFLCCSLMLAFVLIFEGCVGGYDCILSANRARGCLAARARHIFFKGLVKDVCFTHSAPFDTDGCSPPARKREGGGEPVGSVCVSFCVCWSSTMFAIFDHCSLKTGMELHACSWCVPQFLCHGHCAWHAPGNLLYDCRRTQAAYVSMLTNATAHRL